MQDHEELQAEQSLARLTAQVASAYVSNNTISTADVGRLIGEIARQLRAVGEDQQAPAPEKLAPAVSVRRSIGRDHLVCLACGKKQRMLKRHLATEHDLTPNAYREMFSLKPDYPMVAASYAEARRELALKIGLGRPRKPPRKRRRLRRRRRRRPRPGAREPRLPEPAVSAELPRRHFGVPQRRQLSAFLALHGIEGRPRYVAGAFEPPWEWRRRQ